MSSPFCTVVNRRDPINEANVALFFFFICLIINHLLCSRYCMPQVKFTDLHGQLPTWPHMVIRTINLKYWLIRVIISHILYLYFLISLFMKRLTSSLLSVKKQNVIHKSHPKDQLISALVGSLCICLCHNKICVTLHKKCYCTSMRGRTGHKDQN